MKERPERSRQRDTRGAYEKLEKAYRELKETNLEMIFRLALLAEYRDITTGVHLVRIADYSAVIAEGLGLPAREIETIRHASPMHDVGKIMLPDNILKKQGKLTPEEMEIVRKHPEAGANVFKNAKSPIMKACGIIALTHHEKFDGSGYPKGLKGEEIPLYGRIVCLADFFEAFSSKRPYKKARSFEESVSAVMEGAGKHFDPSVVMAFVRNKEKIRGIWEANRDIADFLESAGLMEEPFA